MEVIEEIVKTQREYYYNGETKSYAFRKQKLETLRKVIKEYEPEVLKALKEDLHKSEWEAYTTEIGFLLEEIKFTLKHLKEWMSPERAKSPVTHLGSKSYVHREPYGVTLIIAPWNYPFQLQIAPLVGAIAAGNCAVLKPSELTPAVSAVIAKMIREVFPINYIAVVEGGVDTSTELLKQSFDHIFFTGSVPVGKVVMEAAAKQLIPVTLELGGKSPAIVNKDANLNLAAKRIMWGKFTNAGQTCIAPDYLYVHRDVKKALLEQMAQVLVEFYGEDPLSDEKYGHIVSDRHFHRLKEFLNDGDVLIGGQHKEKERVIAPTIMDNVSWEDSVMQEEIFGPILPVLEFTDIHTVIDEVRRRPKPLALYFFSESEKMQDLITSSISFGGGCMNDTLMHIVSPYLPFGGVGSSGTGSYHGQASFEAFSHQKSIVKQTTKFDFAFRYPSAKNRLKMIKRIMG
ncbi:aldehyde dehydrogenase [Guptibacillus hwajinpoensis]|uniref:aldehyde dehydrogenase n=1 Tax=Guptibacillus hwajinpoensis TaxID=208199 RepID=UPI001CFE0A6C|nr:aldehyde dehydrogenase [Pseudalkalibacillus hwajinpoensis]WLR60933.1 aldehyde dehydrogenase [Pseudalkalibacillus hwajinpoensis]